MTSQLLTAPLNRRAFLAAAGAVTASLVLLGNTTRLESASAATGWGEYANGKIPLSALSKVPNGWLRADAAVQYAALSTAFQRQFGKALSVTEGYRTYATQLSIWNDRYDSHSTKVAGSVAFAGKYWTRKPNVSVAAVPGTSIHGWALAIDFGSNVNKAGSTEKKWADKNGPAYGWFPVGNNFGEAWHFEFTPPTTPPPAPAAPKSVIQPAKRMPSSTYEGGNRAAHIQLNRS